MNQNFLGLILIFPLVGFVINILLGKNLPKGLVSVIGCGSVLLSFLLGAYYFDAMVMGGDNGFKVDYFNWLSAGSFQVDFALLFDRLSAMMVLIITGIGFLIHVYSIGYMHDDEGYHRFFAYLNLFVFFMLSLVLGANYLVLFVGWEGVGLCSYLLIGFWFKNQEYNNAAKKAFIMNRIGDLGFLIAVFMIFATFGTLDFATVFSQAATHVSGEKGLLLITILLFVGATGKSAQIPLFTWLPDAMAGPTPVSALIHAATMVTAGIYLIARSHILFVLSPFTNEIILVIGFATALLAGFIGIAQNDIKKVLAYSTVSQLGLMFVALGLGAYSTAMFHLLTHAFFKALLFLGAGSVIHAMSGEQSIINMGGLRKKIPVTFMTFLIGTIAITGIPPFAGFFSKDEILAKAFEHNPVLWGLGLVVSMLTAFYMFRLLYLTFFGSFKGTEEQAHHLHESPKSITIPLVMLAILSAVGGFLGLPHMLGNHFLAEYLSPIFSDLNITAHEVDHALSNSTEIVLMATSTLLATIIWFLCSRAFSVKEGVAVSSEAKGMMKLPANKFYMDEFYQFLIVKPIDKTSDVLGDIAEMIIDAFVNVTSGLVWFSSMFVRMLQTGGVGFYVFAMVLSLVGFFLYNFSIKFW